MNAQGGTVVKSRQQTHERHESPTAPGSFTPSQPKPHRNNSKRRLTGSAAHRPQQLCSQIKHTTNNAVEFGTVCTHVVGWLVDATWLAYSTGALHSVSMLLSESSKSSEAQERRVSAVLCWHKNWATVCLICIGLCACGGVEVLAVVTSLNWCTPHTHHLWAGRQTKTYAQHDHSNQQIRPAQTHLTLVKRHTAVRAFNQNHDRMLRQAVSGSNNNNNNRHKQPAQAAAHVHPQQNKPNSPV